MSQSRAVRISSVVLTILALAGLGAAPVFAEGITRVRGTVVDGKGKPMAGVPIYFEGVDIKKTIGPLRTSKKGEYLIATLDVTVVKKWHVVPKLDGYKIVKMSYEIVDSSGQERAKQDDHILGTKQELPDLQFALIGDTGHNIVDFMLAKDSEFVAVSQAELKKRQAATTGAEQAAAAAAPPAAPEAQAPAAGPKISPEGAQLLTKAKQMADAGNHEQAIEMYKQYLAKDPTGLPSVYYYLGKSLFETGDDAAAKQSFAKAAELKPDMKGAHFFLGNIALRQDDAAGAAAEYEQELKLSPDSDAVLYNLGQAYFKSGEYDRALAALDRAATVNPSKAETFMLMASVYDAKGDKAKADEMFQKVAQIDPRNAAILFFNAGVKSWNENRPKEAIQAYQKAVEIDPNYAQAHRELGRALMAQQDFAGALTHFQEYLKLDPKAPDAKEIQDSIALLKK
jgi:tetratricopeptide (TPR) repeat protein